MFEVTRELRFCYGHRLLAYDGKCRYLHGHNGRALITLATADLDRLGMVVDFSEIKRVVGGWIDSRLGEGTSTGIELPEQASGSVVGVQSMAGQAQPAARSHI